MNLTFEAKGFFFSGKRKMDEGNLKTPSFQKSSFEIYYIDIISSAIASASKSR